MAVATITRGGKKFVLVPEAEYHRLSALPPFPPADKDGNSNAVEFARVSIARKLREDRENAGLSQNELAKRSGVRQETISRIESGKHTATIKIIDKLDRVIQRRLAKA